MATPDVAGGGADTTVADAISAVLANGGGGTVKKNLNTVPLWQVAPSLSGAARKLDAMDKARGETPSSLSEPTNAEYHTKEYASSAFLDMSPADQKAFRDKAIAAGLISEKATPAQIIQAWGNMVDQTDQYNASRDKSQWISPWQLIDKVGPGLAAEKGASFDAFAAKTNTSIKQYSSSDLATSAESILKSELGRSPTQAELAAFTIAVNHASTLNPVTTTQTPLAVDAAGNPTNTMTTTTGGIDPNQVMLDSVRSSPEHATYQAAADLYPAAMKALGAIV